MSASSLIEVLRAGRVVLMDGAMYTELHRAGLGVDECGEMWNLTFPERVRAIHQSYADAGATVFVTNTFQASPAALAQHGLESRLGEISRAAVAIAREAAGLRGFVLASIGPAVGPTLASAQAMVEALEEADGLLLETQSNVEFLEMIVEVNARRQKPLPLLFSFTFLRDPEGRPVTTGGLVPEECARKIGEYPVTALGTNCGRDIDMEETITIVRGYKEGTNLPLFARPNAGTPRTDAEDWIFPRGVEEMARRGPDLLGAGASMVGGCCGTTPEHIAAFRAAIGREGSAQE